MSVYPFCVPWLDYPHPRLVCCEKRVAGYDFSSQRAPAPTPPSPSSSAASASPLLPPPHFPSSPPSTPPTSPSSAPSFRGGCKEPALLSYFCYGEGADLSGVQVAGKGEHTET
eukprot:Sspe_Gene.119551::Locus_115750_Transcript_1_1_Confidence_1.000_Length_1118::g.119551::m.119551